MKEYDLYLHTAEEEIPFSRCTERESMTVSRHSGAILLRPQGTQDIIQFTFSALDFTCSVTRFLT